MRGGKRFYADLHVHSYLSRATSGDLNLESLHYWAQLKGISLVGTGDFTNPKWFAELKEKLEPAEEGLFRLKPQIAKEIDQKVSLACRGEVRFILQVEIASIYSHNNRIRKVHNLILLPGFKEAELFNQRLSRLGNLASDGRPILGLNCQDLLSLSLEVCEEVLFIPAHIWTPWFSVLGSKSGYDSLQECYGELCERIYAVETGLSSDPAMNWRCSFLDNFALVSNSDAHSAAKLARECNIFEGEISYYAMKQALRTREGFLGTVEFFPEEGKYHYDGHRKCEIGWHPSQTKEHSGICPVCGKKVTVGVLNRVEELADRGAGEKPATAKGYHSLIGLSSILGELYGCGEDSKKVNAEYKLLLDKYGSELKILLETPPEELKGSHPLLPLALTRMRQGKIIISPGYDGKFGIIRVFDREELKNLRHQTLFPVEEAKVKTPPSTITSLSLKETTPSGLEVEKPSEFKPNSDQLFAIQSKSGPLLIIAGPGTGKTMTLTARIAHLLKSQMVRDDQVLAITFTQKAASQMRERLSFLLERERETTKSNSDLAQPSLFAFQAHPDPRNMTICTFHAFCYQVLKEDGHHLGIPPDFMVKEEGMKEEETRDGRVWLDFDQLLDLTIKLFEQFPGVADKYRKKYKSISIDEFQDINAAQYQLVRHLSGDGEGLCVIGDPDQAIYGFRGSDVRFFEQLLQDFKGTKIIHLKRNYRSSQTIVKASSQVIKKLQSGLRSDNLESILDEGAEISIYRAATDRAEAEFVVSEIERLLGGTTHFSLDSGRVESYCEALVSSLRDFAVLYRLNAQGEALEEAFNRIGIPYQRVIKKSFKEINKLSIPSQTSPFPSPDRPLLPSPFYIDADFYDQRADRVSLLTIHSAKGLEFSVVFIVGCEEGLIPCTLPLFKEKSDPDEERRLFYVAMTRAKHRLYLTYANQRALFGKTFNLPPSHFLKDIEKSLLRKEMDKSKKPPKPLFKQMDLDL